MVGAMVGGSTGLSCPSDGATPQARRNNCASASENGLPIPLPGSSVRVRRIQSADQRGSMRATSAGRCGRQTSYPGPN
jgi:hypothetical protein